MKTMTDYDKDTFVDALVRTVKQIHTPPPTTTEIRIPNSMRSIQIPSKYVPDITEFTIPDSTFKYFKKELHYQQMFGTPKEWREKIWNSKHNPLNFDTPMFMGVPIKVIPDNEGEFCYVHTLDQKIPFEYSLKAVKRRLLKDKYSMGWNLTIIKSRADIFKDVPKNEIRATELLRERITEVEFRKYQTYGFITVKGPSGKIYQIFRRNQHIKVWLNGKIVEEICINFKNGKIPLTDRVFALKIMIETNEDYFRSKGNVYRMKEEAA